MLLLFHCHWPIHDVAPSAVTIAVAIDAIICKMNLMVSFLLIVFPFFFRQKNISSYLCAP